MSNKFISLLLIVCMLLSFSACGDETTNNGKIPSASTKSDEQDTEFFNQKVSLVELTSTGEIPYNLFVGSLANVKSYEYGNYARYLDTELFPFQYNSKYGYADYSGKVVISEKYDYFNFFSEDKAFVKINKTWKVINTLGDELFTIPEGYDCSNSFFQNGKALLTQSFQVGQNYIDRQNYNIRLLIITEDMKSDIIEIEGGKNLKYKTINTPEFAGILTYTSSANNDSIKHIYTLFDTAGKLIWTVTIDTGENWNCVISKELFEALGSGWLIFTNAGITSLDTFIVKNGYMNIVDENKKWGLLNVTTGEIIMPCNYDFVGIYSEGLVSVCNYGKWGYTQIDGNESIPLDYKYTSEFINGRAFVITPEEKYCVIDQDGNILTEYNITLDDDVNQIFPFSSETGISVIKKGWHTHITYNLITATGECLISGNLKYISNNYIFIDEHMYKIER